MTTPFVSISCLLRAEAPPWPSCRCGHYRESGVSISCILVLQRGFEMWCNAARQSCMEGGQYDGPDRDHAQDGLGDPRYGAPGGGVARLSRHLQPVVAAAWTTVGRALLSPRAVGAVARH